MKSHQKGFLKLKCFFSSQNIDFPFYLKRILELVFFHLSLLYIYIYIYMLHLLMTQGV
jgi:hypothetical protein